MAEALNGRSVHVDKVVDGDTLHVRAGSERAKVRILGIDCPEARRNRKCMRQGKAACEAQIPRGKRATRRAVELANRKTVTLESADKCDKYGRVLAYVRLGDSRDLGLTLIREGLCDDFSRRYPHARGTAYSTARP